jgi:hypothetical protein
MAAMRKLLLVLISTAIVGIDCSLAEEAAKDESRIHVEDFTKQLPIGLLNVPLGTVVTVKCRSFLPTKEESGFKDAFWKRQVEIIEANGKALKPPVRIEWTELSYSPVDKPPVGTTIEVVGYETGSFDGIPKDLPIAAGPAFAFHSKFSPMKLVSGSTSKR